MVDERDVFETNVNTDGRKQYDWESKYPECAQKEMKKEAIYIAIILIIAFSLLIFIVGGLIDKVGNLIGLEAKKTASLEGVIIYFFSGLLGGTIFGLKYFYRVVSITPQVSRNTLTFKLNSPHNLSIEVNGDIFHNLHLFANPIDRNNPLKPGMNPKKLKKNRNLIYFGPGIHQLPGDTLDVPSGKTVYISGGAIVRGCIRAKNAENVTIFGRGEVHPEGRGAGVSIINSKNIRVEGLITTQCPTGGSDSVTIRNVKAISSYGWGDGMNVFASNNVLFDGVFCRNSDDCTTVYATCMGFKGGCKNITMQNSTLWADVAHPIFIGLHGDAEGQEVMENLNYINIDILDYQGCFGISCGDNNVVRDIVFDNIRVEDFRQGQLFNIRIFFNKKYCAAPGRGIENVLFKDITYNGENAELSIIAGYNEERKVKNIRFENLRINGEAIYDDMPGKPKWYKMGDMARFFMGGHVEGVTFTK